MSEKDFEFPTTLDECIEKWGIEYVYTEFKRMMDIRKNQKRLARMSPEQKRKLRNEFPFPKRST